MRKHSYLFFVFVVLTSIIFFSLESKAADPNDFRKPNNWQRERTINDSVNKSSVKVEASKTYPVSTPNQYGKAIKQIRNAKSTVTLGASTANVGKSLLKRAPAIAITQAVTALLLKSVDWVMDAENNRVKYKELDDGIKKWVIDFGGKNETWGSSLQTVFYAYHAKIGKDVNPLPNKKDLICTTNPNGLLANCVVEGVAQAQVLYKPEQAPPSSDEWKYISISDIAAKVINHAEDGQAPAMQVMNDAALDALEAGLLDAQLDAASNVPQPDPQEITQAQYDNPDYPENGTGTGTGPETPVDPETPTDPVDPNPNPNPDANPFQLPPFCSWASKVCDFIDWVQTEPPEPPESGEVDVQIPDSNMHEGILERLYINMPAQCPPDPILEFMGAKIPFPMSIFCQFAEMMKPLILLFAYIKGLSIIGNGLT